MLDDGHRHALVIGADKFSSVLDWQDRSTCVLFGDAAGAVVLGRVSDPARGILGCDLGVESTETGLLCIPGGGRLHPPSLRSVEHRQHFIKMKGREVFKRAVRFMAGTARVTAGTAREILEQHRLGADEVACGIPHQAIRRNIETLARNWPSRWIALSSISTATATLPPPRSRSRGTRPGAPGAASPAMPVSCSRLGRA